MTETTQNLLVALSAALNEDIIPKLSAEVIEEAKRQAVLSLICSDSQSYSIMAHNVRLMWEQQRLSEILLGLPYMVLKGAGAAIYYPDPLRRGMGDIDIIVNPESFDSAFKAIEEAGYTTNDSLESDNRHAHFYRNDIGIELHRRFATLQTREQEILFDEWLYMAEPYIGGFGSYTFPMPPDSLNGLVLLMHINQHLESGVGIRQVLDWIMYVRHSLSDREWPLFKEMTDQLGLTTLALVTARLGQKYLRLNTSITWCLEANENTVDKFLQYIFNCGDFGRKKKNNTIVMVLSHGRGGAGFFKNLQQRGLANWGQVQKHPWLKPFAWIYQLFRYIRKGLRRGALLSFKQDITSSIERNELLDELGATRLALKK